MIRRCLVLAMMLVAIAFPQADQASGQEETIRVPVLILVGQEHIRVEGDNCYIATAAQLEDATLEATPTPAGEVVSSGVSGGTMVTGDHSPIPGQDGCLLEFELDLALADSYSFQLIVDDDPQEWAIQLDEMGFISILQEAPQGIKYHFDYGTFEAAAENRVPQPEEEATPSADSGARPIRVSIGITADHLWVGQDEGCIGSGDASWINADTVVTIGEGGSTTGVQTEPIGTGELSTNGYCTWELLNTQPINDTGDYLFVVGDHSITCSTDQMSVVGDFYFASLMVNEDGLQCISVHVE